MYKRALTLIVFTGLVLTLPTVLYLYYPFVTFPSDPPQRSTQPTLPPHQHLKRSVSLPPSIPRTEYHVYTYNNEKLMSPTSVKYSNLSLPDTTLTLFSQRSRSRRASNTLTHNSSRWFAVPSRSLLSLPSTSNNSALTRGQL